MSVASLTRFTVPLASDQSAQSQGLLMPKLKYRFRIIFENFGVTSERTELTKQVIDATRPTVTFDEILLDVYNSKIKLAGKPSWNDISVNLRDDASGAISRLVGEQLQRQFDFFEQSSARAGISYKFTMKIEMLDGGNGADTPIALEVWELYGCYLSEVNYNDLNYATSEPATIGLTIKYDNALQTPLGAGVGAPVERVAGSTATG